MQKPLVDPFFNQASGVHKVTITDPVCPELEWQVKDAPEFPLKIEMDQTKTLTMNILKVKDIDGVSWSEVCKTVPTITLSNIPEFITYDNSKK